MRDFSWFKSVSKNSYIYKLHSMNDTVTTEVKRIEGIVDVKRAPAGLDKTIEESTHTSKSDCRLTQSLFDKYEDLFNTTVGT